MKIFGQPRFNRLDAADTYFLTQQLESLDPTTYYELVPSRLGRRFIPPVEGVAPYDTAYKYAMTSLKGRAKKMGPRSKGAPTVEVTRTETTQGVKTFESSFGWSVDEIKAAKAKNLDLDRDKYSAAVVSIEQQIDTALAFGIPELNAPGLVNNALVQTTAPIAKTGGGTSWLGAAVKPAEIIKDIGNMIGDIRALLKSARIPGQEAPMFQKFTLLLPTEHLTLIATTPRSDNSDTTILDYVLQNFRRWLAGIEDWWQLDTADGGSPQAVMYPAIDSGAMNPFAGGGILPMDFETLNPQESGRDISIPAAGKCGGTVMRYPLAFRYMKTL